MIWERAMDKMLVRASLALPASQCPGMKSSSIVMTTHVTLGREFSNTIISRAIRTSRVASSKSGDMSGDKAKDTQCGANLNVQASRPGPKKTQYGTTWHHKSGISDQGEKKSDRPGIGVESKVSMEESLWDLQAA